MNRKALSPVVASIILIAFTVAVSIAVAAWTGALTFNFNGPNYPVYGVTIPRFGNATHAHAWVDSWITIADTSVPTLLPFNLTFSTSYNIVTLKVDYYILVPYGQGITQDKFLGHEEYSVNVTELWKAKP